MELEDYFDYYTNTFDKFIFIIFDKISLFSYIKYNYFINLFIESNNLFFSSLLLNKNSIFNFKCGVDFTAIDFYFKLRRFKLVYIFLNLNLAKKVCLFTNVSKSNNIITSISSIYKSFN